MKQWLAEESDKMKRAPRSPDPALVVYYWDGSAPEGRHIRDISESGAYVYTTERWYVGTIVRIMLQGYRNSAKADGTTAPTSSITILARVVRHGPDGIAVAFSFRDKKEQDDFQQFLTSVSPAMAPPSAIEEAPSRRGQGLIEFALIVPLVFLLAVNAVNFGGFLFAGITVANAARAGAQYMVLSSASPGPPTPATLAQITTLVTNDVTSLLNRSSVVVAICYSKSTAPSACTSFIDPEAPTYTLATVDVTYTYKPFIPLFSFPQLGIQATLPATTIHRKSVMRMLQ